MIAQLRPHATGLGAFGKAEKVYLDNTNIMHALVGPNVDKGAERETFFFNQLRVEHDVSSSPVSDFLVDGLTFEVGGKNKGFDQLKGVENGFVVADDIEYGSQRTLPLWTFGLTY